MAEPKFKDVNLFDSRELISNRIRAPGSTVAESARVRNAGIPRQERNYFWYRKTFRAPGARSIATLKVAKAQFGTSVRLNGKSVGEHAGGFTAGYFDLTDAIRWGADNDLLIRVGAHPAVLPDTYPTGTDFEKLQWTPGIYDSVSLEFADNPRIESVQVAPRIATSEILVQTKLINRGRAGEFVLRHTVRPAKEGQVVAQGEPVRVKLAAGETQTLTETIRIPGARSWSPEHPNLYMLETRTDGDSARTRFGMREFRSDARTKRFYLNGQVRYLRGTNITLHRFFEDPERGALPWDEAWLRRLLVDIPRSMHWDSMRFCIGPVPDKWLEIADEAGLLIQNEFFVWTGDPSWDPGYSRTYDVPETIRQYSEWVRDNWNHPSVVIWDANNETLEPLFGDKIIPAVRGLDLSNRPWENSFNPAAAPDDPREDHPYLFIQDYLRKGDLFDMASLETMDGSGIANGTKSDHARLINEYGWLWLNRDGTPTPLTEKLYARLLGPGATSEQRISLNAYLLAAETEFWRAHRQYAGLLHFVYLTGETPGSYTGDHFKNVRSLELEPQFADYVGEAFKPLGVYLKFHQPTLRAGETRAFRVMLVNDRDIAARGILELDLRSEKGEKVGYVKAPFAVEALGDAALELTLTIPRVSGEHLLVATAWPGGSGWTQPTVSRRRVVVLE
ncbi:MAG TPA: glycoside hydrolase family 2 TIM barrel-domain containing protein [Steroidobacteraceae bacterium]|nr:glycoside hydrolase family 2 TIM barrel-domain containing protein [Steroidobacteraceae bacterium]